MPPKGMKGKKYGKSFVKTASKKGDILEKDSKGFFIINGKREDPRWVNAKTGNILLLLKAFLLHCFWLFLPCMSLVFFGVGLLCLI